jgi:formate dehydrogenase beta subunit
MGEAWETRMRRLPVSRAPRAEEIARAGNELVEENYTAAEARSQAERCLRCDVQTVFEGEKCIACNGCVDVCPDDCLHLVGLAQVASNPEMAALAQRQLGISAQELSSYTPVELNRMGAVMLKDETACIRCSMCATRCPTHAFTMRRFVFHRELATETKVNPRLHREAPVS